MVISLTPPPPFYRQFSLYIAILPFLSLFGTCTFGNIFWQDSPNEIQNKHKNKLVWQSHFFMFRRLQNNVTFFYMQHFYM